MPEGWTLKAGFESDYEQADAWQPPAGFEPVTQLEHARVGNITPQMQRAAEREPHSPPSRFATKSPPVAWSSRRTSITCIASSIHE